MDLSVSIISEVFIFLGLLFYALYFAYFFLISLPFLCVAGASFFYEQINSV